jgi:hypothetical protein
LKAGGVTQWSIYNPASTADLRFYNTTGDKLTLTQDGDLTLSRHLNVNGVFSIGGVTPIRAIIRTTAASASNTLNIPGTANRVVLFGFGGTCYVTAGGNWGALDLRIDGNYADNAYMYSNVGGSHFSVSNFTAVVMTPGNHTISIGNSTGFGASRTDANDSLWVWALVL